MCKRYNKKMKIAMRYLSLLAFLFLQLSTTIAAEELATADYLRCEYKVDPLGIDVVKPRLFWEMQDDRRGAKQTAYQILVASSPEKLAADQGDLWDSGSVESNQTAQIVYAGKPLASRMRCHWKVRLWDHEGKPSAWSKPASGRWACSSRRISHGRSGSATNRRATPSRRRSTSTIANGFGFPKAIPQAALPPGRRYFRGKATLSQDKKIKEAHFVFGRRSRRTDRQRPLHRHGEWRRAPPSASTWPTSSSRAKTASPSLPKTAAQRRIPPRLAGKLVVTFDDGETADRSHRQHVESVEQRLQGRRHARVAPIRHARLEGSGFSRPTTIPSWAAAKELGPGGRKTDRLLDPSARLPAVAEGISRSISPFAARRSMPARWAMYRMHLNGQTVGKDYLTPGWTDYHQRVYYNTYDVTDLVKQGPNAVGGILGPGWYAGPVSTIARRESTALIRGCSPNWKSNWPTAAE